MQAQDKSLMSYSFPDGVVTEEAANLSKCHWSLSPGILPTRKVVDTQTINVGLIQLPVGREKREREREMVSSQHDEINYDKCSDPLTFHPQHQRWCS